MALRINTNIAAMTAHKNMIKNDNGLSASLEKLSSGLRINKAADDASGMAIADALKSQSLGLGQAIRNANDGISMVQTADGALDESINIVNTIKTKAIQAAQDGQTTDSRKAIQSDINKLLEELDIIAKTTAFNGQKLLSGNFTNKAFQIGAYSQETVGISIASSESTKIGHITNSTLTFGSTGTAELSFYSNIQDATFNLNSIEIAYNNNRENSLGAVADAINKLSDVLGVSANAVVRSTTDAAVASGATDNDFKINGITIGQVSVVNNDADGSLVKSINQKTSEHGVYASTDAAGKLTLTSVDGRAIQLTATSITNGTNTGVNAVLGQTDMSTLGHITLTQTGASEVQVSNSGSAGLAVATVNPVEVNAATSATTSSSSISAGSILGAGTTLASGTAISNSLRVDTFTTQGATTVGAGSTLISGTVLAATTSITSDVTVTATTLNNGTLTAAEGSKLQSGSVIGSGTTFTSNMTISGLVTSGDVTLGNGSILEASSVIASGTSIVGSLVATGTVTFAANEGTVGNGSIFTTGSILAEGTVFSSEADIQNAIANLGSGTYTAGGGGFVLDVSGGATGTLSSGFTLSGGTILVATAGTEFATLSTLKTGTQVNDDNITLNADMTISGGNMLLKAGGAGSTINSGTVLAAGSYAAGEDFVLMGDAVLSADMVLQGTATATIASGSVLSNESVASIVNITLAADATLTAAMQLAVGSDIEQDSIFANGSRAEKDAVVLASAATLSNAQTLGTGSVIGADSALNTGSTFGADIVLKNQETVLASSTMNLAADSVVKAGSVFAVGTVLTNDITGTDGATYAAGATLDRAVTLASDATMTNAQDVKGGSILAAGTTLAANTSGSGAAIGSVGSSTMTRLSEVNVLTQEGAQIGISVADSALKDLDKVRADLGSVQNQLTSTIANLSATKVNISAAESSIRDVDFAEEAANFSKMQILNQAGSFAMAQANASSQNVLSLLQG